MEKSPVHDTFLNHVNQIKPGQRRKRLTGKC